MLLHLTCGRRNQTCYYTSHVVVGILHVITRYRHYKCHFVPVFIIKKCTWTRGTRRQGLNDLFIFKGVPL